MKNGCERRSKLVFKWVICLWMVLQFKKIKKLNNFCSIKVWKVQLIHFFWIYFFALLKNKWKYFHMDQITSCFIERTITSENQFLLINGESVWKSDSPFVSHKKHLIYFLYFASLTDHYDSHDYSKNFNC